MKAINHEVLYLKSGRKIGYGALAEAASSLTIPVDIKLKDPSDFRYVGKGKTDIVDGFDITTGRAQYGIDVRVDGMLYGVVARPPVYAGKVKSYDASETMKVPGSVPAALIGVGLLIGVLHASLGAANMVTAAAGVATGSGAGGAAPGRRRGRPVTAAMASSMRSR